jgi:spore coat protein A, manganese oxidase
MLNRRDLLRLGVLGSSAALIGWRFPGWMSRAWASQSVPFSVPLPIPPVLQPVRSDASGDYYELTMQAGRAQLREGSATEILGFDGIWPGPTIRATRGRPTHILATNLMSHDGNIHNHGAKVVPEHDGHIEDRLRPGESREYVYPNDQNASTYWYHDHTFNTAENIYRGLAGFYLITDPAEDDLNLPSGDYDIPLMIQDRTLRPDNSLFYEVTPETIEFGFVGDTIFVNGAPTPFLDVANRKYRFRVLNAANRSEFVLRLGANDPMTVIGSDGGLLEAPETRGMGIMVYNGDRYDIVIDFSRYEVGTSVQLSGRAADGTERPIMRFDITREEQDDSNVPAHLTSVERLRVEDAVATRSFTMDLDQHGHWTINGRAYEASRIDAYPRLGTTEIWEFISPTDRRHDMHLHGVHFQWFETSGFSGSIPPYRSGWKDTITIPSHGWGRILVRFEDHAGLYMFHCHMLEHGDHHMMAQFEVVGPDDFRSSTTPLNASLVCPLPTST